MIATRADLCLATDIKESIEIDATIQLRAYRELHPVLLLDERKGPNGMHDPACA